MAKIPGADVSIELNTSLGGGSTAQLRLLGPDIDTLTQLADEAEAIIQTVPGVVDLRNKGAERSPETQILIDRSRATDLGLYAGQVGVDLRTAVNGKEIGTLKPDNASKELDIVLRLDTDTRADMDKIMQLPLGYYSGNQISLGQVTYTADTDAPGKIERFNRQPSMLIEYGTSGAGAADVANEIEAALQAQVDFPPGYEMEFVGLTDAQRDAFSQLGAALMLSVYAAGGSVRKLAAAAGHSVLPAGGVGGCPGRVVPDRQLAEYYVAAGGYYAGGDCGQKRYFGGGLHQRFAS